jgi:aminotransferase
MHALEIAFSTLLDEGDEVIVPSPCYFLEGIIEPRGGKLIYVPMREEDNYRWDFDRLESNIGPRAKCVFLNTPVNPTGYVLTADDLDAIARIVIKHDLLVVADESYDKLIYDGLKHRSIASLPGMQERTILIRSFTKSYAMPNWRVGYIVAPADLVEHFTKVLEWMTLFGSYLSQKAATAALTGPQDWLKGMASEFQSRRDLVYRGIKEIEGLSCVKPLSGPFVFLNVSQLRGTCQETADVLLNDFGVSTVPGSYFHSGDHIRMAFGGKRTVLEEILKRWKRAVEQIGLDEAKVLQSPINSLAK